MNDIDINIEVELKENLSQGLIKGFKIYRNTNNRIEGFILEILEGTMLDFELGDNYCYVEKKSKLIYESFEEILHSLSPLYTDKFNEILIQKMSQFQNSQD